MMLLCALALQLALPPDTLRRNLPAAAVAASVDRQGNLYYADEKGSIHKLDSLGRSLQHFSPQQPAAPTLLEAWQGLKVFIFYRDFQAILWVDRFLADAPLYNLSGQLDGYARLACPSADDRVWLLDEVNLRLLKLDLRSNQVLLTTPLDLVLGNQDYHLSFMAEHANQLYIVAQGLGILVFDNLGNYRNTLPFGQQGYLPFWREALVVNTPSGWQAFRQLGMQASPLALPQLNPGENLVVAGGSAYVFSGKLLLRYRLP